LDISIKEVNYALRIGGRHLSLDAPFYYGDEKDSSLFDLIEDQTADAPDEDLLEESLKKELENVLRTLTSRQAEIVRLYFGLGIERPLTLEEIGERFRLTRERVRQIKEKAIQRLRHSSRSRKLRHYLG
ncbi:MAG TPA: sigma-70 family RNA polymerase sigma factor, partial [Bacteroidetes bacterium]|nr:sigma-70 family RNA polymerase sigma factor [Bacteroidota bacterium]